MTHRLHCAPSGTRQRPPELRQKKLFLKMGRREGHSVLSEAKQESIDIFNGGWLFSKVSFGEKKEIDFPPKPGISLISYLEIQGGAHSA